MSELDANIIVNGQKAVATVAQTGTVIQDGGAIDATSVIQTASGPQKVVKTYDLNGGGGGGGGTSDYSDLSNKPQINSVTLTGNKTGADLGLLSNSATGSNSIAITKNSNTTSGADSVNINPKLPSGDTGGNQTLIGSRSISLTSYGITGVGYNSQPYNAYCTAIGYDAYAGGGEQNPNRYSATAVGKGADTAHGTAIGSYAHTNGKAVAVGVGYDASHWVQATGFKSIAVGVSDNNNLCEATAQEAIQLGVGTNAVAKQFQVYSYPMLDGNTGKIPTDRMTKVIELTTTSVELASDNIYNGAELASVTFTLPATVPVNFTAQLNFTSGTTATVLTAPNTINFEGDDCTGGAFTPVASKRYQVLIASDGVNVNGYVIGR